MKHHFADFLDRSEDYWTMIPNIERFAYFSDVLVNQAQDIKIATISKEDKNWKVVLDSPNLEELTLHEASKEQVQAIRKLNHLKRLRITFLRTNDIEFIGDLHNLEELILEYVSGFSDLSPLSKLTKLKSVHFENLRRVSNFNGLTGITSLKYLYITGTLDWKQPIENFEFLKGLPNLEVLSLGWVTTKTEFPAFLPILSLKRLKRIKIIRDHFKTDEYAFLEAALPHTKGATWDLFWERNDRLYFLGKGAGFIGDKNPNLKVRCDEFSKMYDLMKKQSEDIIRAHNSAK